MKNLQNLQNLSGLGVRNDNFIDPNWFLPLIFNAFLSRGSADIYFARNSTATFLDFEGLMKTAIANEIRFKGARRVRNLATGLTTQSITVENGSKYQVTIKGSNGTTAVCSNAFTGTLTADGTNRISWANGTPKTSGSTTLTITVTGTLTELLVESVTGQANQNPSEYVSSGVIRRNLLVQSEDFSTTWSNSWGGGTTLTTNQATFIDGKLVMDKIAQIDSTNDGIAQISLSLSASTPYTLSIFLKNNNSTQSKLLIYDDNASASLVTLAIDWTAGVPSTNSSSGASNILYENYGNGIYRVSFTCTTAGTVTTHRFVINPETSATATNSIYVCGAQLERSSILSEYQKITNASAIDFNNYHGAGVDGVKYFDYENGNTVDGSGVVTEATGSAIASSTLKGVVIEQSRTNLFSYSEQFDNAYFSKTECSITANQTVAPDGKTTMDVIVDTVTNATHIVARSLTLSTTSRTALSYFVKAKEYDECRLSIYNVTDGFSLEVYFDLGAQTYNLVSGYDAGIESYGNGIYRVWGVGDVPTVASNGNSIALASGGAVTFAGTGTSGLYVWGAQSETGDYPTSYIQTTTASATRQSDNLQSQFGSGNFPQSFSMYMEFTPNVDFSDLDVVNVRLFGTDDSGGGNDEIRTYGHVTDYNYIQQTGGGYFTLDMREFIKDTTYKIGMTVSQEGTNVRAILYVNGVEKYNSTTAGTLDHSDTGNIGIGSWIGNPYSFIKVKQFKLYRIPLNANHLYRLTYTVLFLGFYLVYNSQYLGLI